MLRCLNVSSQECPPRTNIPEIGFCEAKLRLLDDFLEAIRELNGIQSQQTQAVIDGDDDFARFDVLLHLVENPCLLRVCKVHGCDHFADEFWDRIVTLPLPSTWKAATVDRMSGPNR